MNQWESQALGVQFETDPADQASLGMGFLHRTVPSFRVSSEGAHIPQQYVDKDPSPDSNSKIYGRRITSVRQAYSTSEWPVRAMTCHRSRIHLQMDEIRGTVDSWRPVKDSSQHGTDPTNFRWDLETCACSTQKTSAVVPQEERLL